MPIGIKFSNFAFSTLAVGCNAAATSLALASGTGAKFPTLAAGEYFYATLENASLDREVVKVTARSTDAITVVRGQDNTTARSWNAGDSIALRLNAGALDDFKTEVVDATNLIRTSNNTFTGANTFNNTTTFASAPTFGTDLVALAAFDNLKQSATDTYTGVVELATAAEAAAGTDTTRPITPSTLRDGLNSTGTAPIYAARAWVNFNGTGTVAIRAAGNVSSVTDNGIGDYTVNFTTAIADANYSWMGTARSPAGNDTNRTCVDQRTTTTKTSSALAIRVLSGGTTSYMSDSDDVNIAIFR